MDFLNKLLWTGMESVYQEALAHEFLWQDVSFEREKHFNIKYKGVELRPYYMADFVIEKNIILEIKAQQGVIENHYTQVINYLAVSKCPVALLINFGESSLTFKRVAFSPIRQTNKIHKINPCNPQPSLLIRQNPQNQSVQSAKSAASLFIDQSRLFFS
jgi:GxxExxY protein